jgi:O-antigen/teichoic acid export membrane protein
LYFFNLLPSISRSATLPREHLLDLMRRSMSVAAWSSTFVALVVTLVARPLMTAVYGAEYAGAGRLLALLIWMIPISMLSGHYRYTLIGYGRQTLLLYSISASAALSVVLCLALIPVSGAIGAVAGLLAGNLFNLALSYYLVRRTVLRIPLGAHLSRPAFALMLSAALFAVFARLSPWTAAAAAALAYLLLLFHWQRDDVFSLVKALASRQNA